MAAEVRQVVLVSPTDLFDQTVRAQTFQKMRYLPRALSRHIFTNITVAHTADIELAVRDNLKEVLIFSLKKIEAFVRLAVLFDAARDLVQSLYPRAWVVQFRDEV